MQLSFDYRIQYHAILLKFYCYIMYPTTIKDINIISLQNNLHRIGATIDLNSA
jgi:hypothetical protein